MSDLEEKFKRLAEIDALVRRMRSSSIDELSEDELITMMEVAVRALKTPSVEKERNT